MSHNLMIAKEPLTQSGQSTPHSQPKSTAGSVHLPLNRLIYESLKPLLVALFVLGGVLAIWQSPDFIFRGCTLFSATVLTIIVHVLGVWAFWRREPLPLQDEDQSNTHSYDQLSRFIEDLEDELEACTSDLQVAYLELAHLNQVKANFVSIASHELRTPLTSLYGYSEMLLKNPEVNKNADHLELVSGVHNGTLRLKEVVDNLTDLAKSDNQTWQLCPEPVSISRLVQGVGQRCEQTLLARNLTLSLEIKRLADLPLVEADPDALGKVFCHLLSNAIKYTPDGGVITITGRALPRGTTDLAEERIEIVVSDTGIGIDRLHHRLIFTKFYQTGNPDLHSSGKTKYKGGGLGLGLAIARGIVEAHRGRIWAESHGHDEQAFPGSHFHVVLPLRQKTTLEAKKR